MSKKIFSTIAQYYDTSIAQDRFDHKSAVEYIASYMSIDPEISVDLACGSGLMALEILKKYPRTKIHCEELSQEMINVLVHKRSQLKNISKRSLQECSIPTRTGLITIAFNSLNYITIEEVKDVLTRLRDRIAENGIVYFDTLLQKVAVERLGNEESLTKTRKTDSIEICSTLFATELNHVFLNDGVVIEDHKQYIFDEKELDEIIVATGFETLSKEDEIGTIRTRFILAPVERRRKMRNN